MRAAILHDDSPVYQLVDYIPRLEIDDTKSDIFRMKLTYSKQHKDQLAAAVRQGQEAVQKVVSAPSASNLFEMEPSTVVDMFLSLRDVKGYDGMIALYARMPPQLQRAKVSDRRRCPNGSLGSRSS